MIQRLFISISLIALGVVTSHACEVSRASIALKSEFENTYVGYDTANDFPEIRVAGLNEQGPTNQTLLRIWRNDTSWFPIPVLNFVEDGAAVGIDIRTAEMAVPIGSWECLVAPGDSSYLSDGFTDHAAIILQIDREAGTVLLDDDRAEESFLLSKNSIFDDLGGAVHKADGHAILLPLPSFSRVIKSIVVSMNTERDVTIDVIKSEYPGDADYDSLRYWYHANLVATTETDRLPTEYFEEILRDEDGLGAILRNYIISRLYIADYYGTGKAELPGNFGEAKDQFIEVLSKNLNFRLAMEFKAKKMYPQLGAYSLAYMKARGRDIDFLILAFVACVELAATTCSDIKTDVESEIGERLAGMLRADADQDLRQVLFSSHYGSASLNLMRERIETFDYYVAKYEDIAAPR